MATKAAKGAKQTKETDKKGNKKNDELPLVEEKKEDSPVEGESNDTPETVETETVEDLPPPKEPTPEPVYDEPTLSELIIEWCVTFILGLHCKQDVHLDNFRSVSWGNMY